MNAGRQELYTLPINDITSLGGYAQQLQREALARGEELPPAVRLQIGEPSFRTPAHIGQAAIEAIQSEALTYGPAVGWPWLRDLLAEKVRRVNGYEITPQNVAVTHGGTGALQIALMGLIEPGDEVLIPNPGWPHYLMQLAVSRAKAVPYPLDPQHAWLPKVADLEKLLTPRTRVLLINTPGNPTGAVFPASLVAELLEFAARHDLYLLSDECYDEIVFEGKHVSPAQLLSPSELEESRFVGVYTFSKTYAMTGWRIGYLVTNQRLIKTLGQVLDASYTNVSTIAQRAAAAALTGPQECVAAMRAAYQERRDLAVALLKEHGRYVYTPHGAFYALIDITGPNGQRRSARDFSMSLLHERNVAVGPGNVFGSVSESCVRISLAASLEEVERGVREVCCFADRES